MWTFQRRVCNPLHSPAQSIPSMVFRGPWKWVWKMVGFGLKQSDLEPGRTPHRESVQEETLPSESPDPPHLFWGAWINQHFILVWWHNEMTWLWFQRVRRRGFITYNRILDYVSHVLMLHVIYEFKPSKLRIVHFILVDGWKFFLPCYDCQLLLEKIAQPY